MDISLSSLFVHRAPPRHSTFIGLHAGKTFPAFADLGDEAGLHLSSYVNSPNRNKPTVINPDILLTWPYHCSLFFSIMSMMSCFPFTPTISFICSFFILSLLYFLADLLSTSISVDKILFFLW